MQDKSREKDNKKTELPANLLPKFPENQKSQRLKKRPSRDKVEVAGGSDEAVKNEEEEKSPENLFEEGLMDEVGKDDEDLPPIAAKESMERAQASPSDAKSVNCFTKKPKVVKPEKSFPKALSLERQTSKSNCNDRKSGRSNERKQRNKESLSSDDRKSVREYKKKDTLRKKPSWEHALYDDMRKSTRRSSKVLKKSVSKARVPKSASNEKSCDDKGKKTPQQQPSGGGVKKEPPVVGLPPKTPMKLGMSALGGTGASLEHAQPPPPAQPTASAAHPPTPVQTPQSVPKKKKVGFFGRVYHKTKNWYRRTDCVFNPTKEVVPKAYVVPEYDQNNPQDFQPDPRRLFNDEEWNTRLKNAGTGREDIFLNNRPYWLTRQPSDTIPKVHIQLYRPLKQLCQGNPAAILPKQPRVEPFCDPKCDSLDKLKVADKAIGVDPTDPNKDKELKRVSANTFYATIMLEVEKMAYDDAQKKNEPDTRQDLKRPGRQEKMQKSWTDESTKKVAFSIPDRSVLKTYNRKSRPQVNSGNSKREFRTTDYKMGEKKIPQKAKTAAPVAAPVAAPPTSGTVTPSASSSTTSLSDGRKS